MDEGFLSRSNHGTLVALRVSPGARESAFSGTYGDAALKLRVAAPPVDGKANEEARRYLAGLLDLPRSSLGIVRGVSGRDKVVLIRGMNPEDVRRVLWTRTG